VQKRPTLLDVAKTCGVTTATVSRVLNNKRNNNFSITDRLRQKILVATRDLGYTADSTARSLSTGSTRVIGLFASPHTHVAEGINEPLIEGVAETLHGSGYEVFFEMTPTGLNNHALPRWRFDGAVLMQEPKPDTVSELDIRGVPYVCVNECAGQPIAQVLADDVMGMNRLITHLLQLGHKRFAYATVRLAGSMHYSVFDRFNTLLAAAQQDMLELAPDHDTPFESATEFLRKTVIEHRATAVIAYDHRRAIMMVGAAQQMGLNIPRDFSLVCFNDVFPVAMLYPPLTVAAVPGREMGRIAADLLLNHMISPQRKKAKEVRVPEDLIVRGSTAPPRA
jgi:DNA-binding LacI/PurR family transcriptional regulator